MSIGIRYFLFADDGSIRHVPQRVADGVRLGEDRMPQFANQSIRIASVILDLDDGKPSKVRKVEGSIWQFDAEGVRSREWMRAAIDSLPSFSGPESKDGVVDLSRLRARHELRTVHSWEPTSKDITRMIELIWPEAAGRPVERPPIETGVAKRKRPMTYEGKDAFREIAMALSTINSRLGYLGDKSLQGLADKVAEEPEYDPAERELWQGVHAAIQRHLAIKRAWRRKGGKWTVVACVTRDLHTGSGKQDVLETRECNGRDAAVKAGREMHAKHANYVDERSRVEVEMWPTIGAPNYAFPDVP